MLNKRTGHSVISSAHLMREFRHDIPGKFKDISTIISTLDDEALSNTANNDVFHAVHEVLLKMVRTSRNTMEVALKQEMILLITDQNKKDTNPLYIHGIQLHYQIINHSLIYIFNVRENNGSLLFNLGKLHALLPFRSIQYELSDRLIIEQLEEVKSLIGVE